MKTGKVLAAAVAAFALALASCASVPGASGGSASGTASGAAAGFGGDITVTITMEGGVITQAVVEGPGETAGIGSRAVASAPDSIVALNSWDIDTVAGATVSTMAIRQAAKQAVEKISGASSSSSAPAVLTLGGKASAGMQVYADDSGNTVSALHRKDGSPLFNLTAAAQAANYGIKLDTDFRAEAGSEVTLNGIYGWAAFMDDGLHVSVGKISDAKWVASGIDPDGNERSYDGVTGARVDADVPFVQGLNVGFALRANDWDTETMLKNTVFGASYNSGSLGSVLAYDMSGNGNILVGVNYSDLVPRLDAGIRLEATNLNTFGSDTFGGQMAVYEKASYRLAAPRLTPYVILGQTFYGNGDKTALVFNPGISCRIDAVPGLTAFFGAKLETPDYFDTNALALKPEVEYSLGGTALIYAEYEMGIDNLSASDPAIGNRFGIGLEVKAF